MLIVMTSALGDRRKHGDPGRRPLQRLRAVSVDDGDRSSVAATTSNEPLVAG
jgi:hypothetical protein